MKGDGSDEGDEGDESDAQAHHWYHLYHFHHSRRTSVSSPPTGLITPGPNRAVRLDALAEAQ